MKFKFNNKDKNKIKFAFKGKEDNPFFDGNKGKVIPAEGGLLLGLGKEEDFNLEVFREAIYSLGRFLNDKDLEEISFGKNDLGLTDKDFVLAIVEALKVSNYKFDYYKREKITHKLKTVNILEDFEKYQDDVDELLKVLEGQFLTRNLVNLRSNDLYPKTLAKYAEDELSDLGVDVKVYKKDEIEEMGLTAFLKVGQGSENPPRFIVMEYLNGDNDENPIVFVGKGVTYDTGGYNIKSADGMKTMHTDMGGAGTVIGAMHAIAANKVKANVVALVAACENSISGGAYKPGDVITARNGMTIEVDNTDAEGRITMADAANYGVTEYKPAMILDIATLTGAQLIALGETYTAAVTNDQDTLDRVLKAAKKANEKIWQLPVDPVYKSYNDSEIADIKNTGGRLGGSITAGLFVGAFVEDTPWVHLDIAGPAYLSKPQGLNQKGATGVHVKTLYELAKSFAK